MVQRKAYNLLQNILRIHYNILDNIRVFVYSDGWGFSRSQLSARACTASYTNRSTSSPQAARVPEMS